LIHENIEDKVQEAVGDLTGDPKAQADGKKKLEEKLNSFFKNSLLKKIDTDIVDILGEFS
jgi:uncharacterized protein YjbJ (UPF0337 family)